ncbi:MAG: hypothetical protein ACYCWE_22015 [Eubacteriales bacterium]
MNNMLKLILHTTLFYVKINIISFFIFLLYGIPANFILNVSHLNNTENKTISIIIKIISASVMLMAFYIFFYRNYKFQENEARQFIKDNIDIEYNPKMCLKNHINTKGKTDFIIFSALSIVSSVFMIAANNVKELKNIGGVIAFLLASPSFAISIIINENILSLIISIIIFILVYL